MIHRDAKNTAKMEFIIAIVLATIRSIPLKWPIESLEFIFSMAYKKRFDTSSAYGQLILLVFLPICILAAVGGILVFYETMRASNSE